MRKITILLGFLFYYFSTVAQIAFQETAKQYNIQHHFVQWTIGGGVSFFDFNQDGLDDLTLSTNRGRRISFYLNNGTSFDYITPSLIENTETVKQILWMDFDNDGDYDLYVAAYEGINRLYQNKGNLSFVDITEQAGLPLAKHRGYGACFGDYNRDGWLDLYYNSRSIPGSANFKNTNRLFKNNADGTFSETTENMNAADANNIPFSSAFLDYNNDMWPDLYTASDKYKGNTLLENKNGLVYEDVSSSTNSNLKINAMCVTPTDYNRDGWTDIYITNTTEGNKFLVNTGNTYDKPIFEENAANLGIAFYNTSWGANFFDADNDGDLDLYISGAEETIGAPTSSIFYENINTHLFEAPFINGFAKDTAYSFCNAIGDFNNDGNLDIIVQNNPPFQFYLWKNTTQNNNHWLKVKLEGTLSNKDGIGAKIECYASTLYQTLYTQCGGSFLGQNSAYQHFGIGENKTIDSLLITWPTGHIDRYFNIASNQILYLKEGDSTNGKIDLDKDVIIIESKLISTASNAFHPRQKIEVAPNLVWNQLSIIAEQPISHIEIYSVNGGLLEKLQFPLTNNYNINVHSYPQGFYFIKIIDKKRKEHLLKWVKI